MPEKLEKIPEKETSQVSKEIEELKNVTIKRIKDSLAERSAGENTLDSDETEVIEKTIDSYQDTAGIAKEVADRLVKKDTIIKENLLFLSQGFQEDEVAKVIKPFENETKDENGREIVKKLVDNLANILDYTNDKETMIESARTLQNFGENLKTIKEVSKWLDNMAVLQEDKEMVKKSCGIIKNFKESPETAEEVASSLAVIMSHLEIWGEEDEKRRRDIRREFLDNIGKIFISFKENPAVINRIRRWLSQPSSGLDYYYSKEEIEPVIKCFLNEDVVKSIKETYKKDPEIALIISDRLGEKARWSKNEKDLEKVLFLKDCYQNENVIKTLQLFFKKPKELSKKLIEEFTNEFENITYYQKNEESATLLTQLIVSSEDVNLHDFKRLKDSGYKEFTNNLTKLAQERSNFSEKIKRIELYKSLRDFGVEVDDPDLTGRWLEGATEAATLKVKEKFKIKRELSLNEVLALLQAKADRNEIEMIQELADSKIEKSFPLDRLYEKIDLVKLKEKGDPKEITKSLVNFLLTTEARAKGDVPKHYQRLREILKFFTPEKLRPARDLVRRKEPTKIFRQIKEDFNLLTKENNEEKAKRIREYFKELAKKELAGKTPEDAEALSDLIDSIESIGQARVFDSLLIKMQKGDMTDLLNNRLTMCCAFYPDGANKEASLNYLRDSEIGLLQLKSATLEGEELDNLGVAILVNCQDKEGKKVLLIDSVEGGDALQRAGTDYQEKLLEAIKKLAKENKQDYILFNSTVNNATPRDYLNFLSKKENKQGAIYLEKIKGVEDVKDWGEEHYLEAFGGWKFPKGEVEGYRIEVENGE